MLWCYFLVVSYIYSGQIVTLLATNRVINSIKKGIIIRLVAMVVAIIVNCDYLAVHTRAKKNSLQSVLCVNFM